MEKLTVNMIAPFGEHKLEVINPTTGFIFTVKGIDYEEEMLIGADPVNDNYPDTYPHCLHSVLPLLRNISCLTKTIQHEGREFCPIVELAKISSPYAETEITEVEFWEEDEEIVCNLIKGTRVIYYIRFKDGNFYTDEEYNRFLDQYELFQKLAEWHINFVGIPEGLYIDKNTLK